MNLFDVITYIAIICLYVLLQKMWTSLDKYFDKKAENLATKQDIEEITVKTETIQTEFYKVKSEFDLDLKFKYQFYEMQYKQLYSELYCKICKSEALRYILNNLLKEMSLDFDTVPIVDYETDSEEIQAQHGINSDVSEQIINLVCTKHIFASPELIKMTYLFDSIRKCDESSNEEANKAECKLKIAILKIILKDYYWLRQQLHLQKGKDETNKNEIRKLQNGRFISI